ncbi:MAG: RluA family pseudouridine synthase, partial [Alphaproteobacteria bacterium]
GPDGAAVTDPRARPVPGGRYRIALPAATPTAMRPEPIPLEVLHEDDELIVIDKPAGMVVHPAAGNWSGTLVNALLHHCAGRLSGIGGVERPGIVHRLDKDTSGVLVVAKTDRAHQALSAQFAAHSVERVYLAVCHGVPDRAEARLAGLPFVSFDPDGTLVIDAPIGRHASDRQRMAVREGGRPARTRVQLLRSFGRHAALVACRLETGRTHQIRVHMARIGHPLIGDRTYGARRRLPERAIDAEAGRFLGRLGRQALHAAVLGFDHPASGARMRFTSPLPGDMAELLAHLERCAQARGDALRGPGAAAVLGPAG